MDTDSVRPAVTELRLSAFKTHRGVTLPLGPLTLLSGESGSGKSSALQAYEILARLGSGERLARAVGAVAGGATACVPAGARPDRQGRRGFRIGCTVDGPAGPVRLDLAVQAEPELRIVGERLTGGGETLLTTALTDPARPAVQAAWHTAGATPVTRAPLPDDRLGTALLPLRVAGKTAGQRLVLAAAEQVVVALRSAFVCDPRPEVMRAAGRGGDGAGGGAGEDDGSPGGGVAGSGGRAGASRKSGGSGGSRGSGRGGRMGRRAEGGDWGGDGEDADEGRLRSSCDNLPAVLERTSRECRLRHEALVKAVREACAGPVDGLRAVPRQPSAAGADARTDAGPAAPVPQGVSGARALRGADARQVAAQVPQAVNASPTVKASWAVHASAAGETKAGDSAQEGNSPQVVRSARGVRAVIDRGPLGTLPVEQLGDGELRFLALALVLLTGPGVLAMDPAGEIPSAQQQLTVMADGMDRCMDHRQVRELVSLAVRMAERGHVRLLGTVRDASVVEGLTGVRVLHLGV